MSKLIGLLAGASLLALAFPSAYERYRASLVAQEEMLDPPPVVVEAATPPPPASGRSIRLAAGPDGHFRTQAKFNGRTEAVLVDTGATYVAVNEATARRLGIRVAAADFRYSAETANGRTPVALARIDRLSLGSVEIRDVEAMVMKGDGLGTTLLGMSFLKKLKRYGVERGALTLIQ